MRTTPYRALVDKYGVVDVYVLSAGWGLIRADFLTPQYNITLKSGAPSLTRRRTKGGYADFCHLPRDCADAIVFLGGKDYLPLFGMLTADCAGQRHVFFNSTTPPVIRECNLIRYSTSRRTNWHYECAKALIRGAVAVTSAR